MPIVPRHHTKGFTLIEALLYITIAATVLLSTVYFINILIQTRIKNQVMADVEDQGTFMTNYLTQALRNASAITISSSTVLSFQNGSGAPTTISQNDQELLVSQNGTSWQLNSPRVLVSTTYFGDRSASGSPYSAVEFGFTLNAANQSKRKEFSYSRTFLDAVTLRNHL